MKPDGTHERLWPDAGRLLDINWYWEGSTQAQAIYSAGYNFRTWRDQDDLSVWGCLDGVFEGEYPPRILVNRAMAGDVMNELAALAARSPMPHYLVWSAT